MEIKFKNVPSLLGMLSTADARSRLLGMLSTADARSRGGCVFTCTFRLAGRLRFRPYFELNKTLYPPEVVEVLYLDPADCPVQGSVIPPEFTEMINCVPAVWVFGSGWYKHPSPIAVSPILNGTPVSPNANGIAVYPNAIGISTSSPPSPNGSPGGFSFSPVFVNSPPMVVLAPDVGKPKCDCGGEKLKTTHYDWCSTRKGA